MVLLIKVKDMMSFEKIRIFENPVHRLEENMLFAYWIMNMLYGKVRKTIERLCEQC